MPDRFDKFSERARRVLTYSHVEAQRFNHNYIGTEHLLLGLVREEEGVAARVLTTMEVGLDSARSMVERIIGRGDRMVMGEIGLTPRAKKVIELAVDEARRLNHQYIEPEHLLLGLVREGEGVAAGVLESLGVSLERVRAQAIHVLSVGAASAEVEIPLERLDDEARRVVARAEAEAARRGQRQVGTDHLVLALLGEEAGLLAEALREVGVDRPSARERLGAFLGPDAAEPTERPALSPGARTAIWGAVEQVRRWRREQAGAADLLLRLIERDQVALWLLVRLGAAQEELRATVKRRRDGP
jgi:ATP-dependent Clp protease ATP-binding subunit ClpA